MTIEPDGITAAAMQETKVHPTRDDGKPVTAWNRRAATLNATVSEVNALRSELDTIKRTLADRPF